MEMSIKDFVIVDKADSDDLTSGDYPSFDIETADLEDFLSDLMINFVDKNFEIISGNDDRYEKLYKSLLDEATKLINSDLHYNFK